MVSNDERAQGEGACQRFCIKSEKKGTETMTVTIKREERLVDQPDLSRLIEAKTEGDRKAKVYGERLAVAHRILSRLHSQVNPGEADAVRDFVEDLDKLVLGDVLLSEAFRVDALRCPTVEGNSPSRLGLALKTQLASFRATAKRLASGSLTLDGLAETLAQRAKDDTPRTVGGLVNSILREENNWYGILDRKSVV